MRPSSRDAILDAAFRLAGHDGGALPITFDAVATEAGVTKGGVLYHFPTRAELVRAVTRYVAQRVEAAMADQVAGKVQGAVDDAADKIKGVLKRD